MASSSSTPIAANEERLQQLIHKARHELHKTDLPQAPEPVYYQPPRWTDATLPDVPPHPTRLTVVNDAKQTVADDKVPSRLLPSLWMDPNVKQALLKVPPETEGKLIAWSVVAAIVLMLIQKGVLQETLPFSQHLNDVAVAIYCLLALNVVRRSLRLYHGWNQVDSIPLTNEQRELIGLPPLGGAPTTPQYEKDDIKPRQVRAQVAPSFNE